jgi:hypothetical protein
MSNDERLVQEICKLHMLQIQYDYAGQIYVIIFADGQLSIRNTLAH